MSTAAEETKNPQRNVPIGLIASLLICTVFYLLVAGGVIGSYGAQPLMDPSTGKYFADGSTALYGSAACSAVHAPLVCSKEALAYVLRQVGPNPIFGNILGIAATIALPSVVLLMMYGQTRVFFVMARDGLLPRALSAVHSTFKTPLLFLVAPLSIAGCLLLFFSLDKTSWFVFFGWTAIGLVLYFAFGFWNSNVRRGIVDSHEDEVPPPPGSTN